MVNNSLYTKYRPGVFDDICGQKYVSKILKNQIKLKKFAHAYLFSGTRGTGKTSCARIFAKAINCLNPIDGNPCCSCVACNQENTNFLNVVELDAASNNSVDQIKAIIEELRYMNFTGGYKIYILDEVHMLSINAFNALLKTLEEPPDNVVFILSTTELKKVPQTVVSRCQKFEFKHIEIQDIVSRLKYISREENIDIDDASLRIISCIGDGSMRDSISILERVLLYKDCIREENVRDILGIVSEDFIFEFLGFLFRRDINNSLSFISHIFDRKDYDAKDFANGFRNVLRDLIFLKINREDSDLLLQRNSRNLSIMEKISSEVSTDELIFMVEQINKIMSKNISTDIEFRIYLEIFIFKYIRNDLIKIESYEDIDLNKTSIHKPKSIKKCDVQDEIDTGKWKDFLIHLRKHGFMVLYSLLQNGNISRIEGGVMFFKCNTLGILNRLKDVSTIKEIECELSRFYGSSLSFEVFSNIGDGNLSIEDKIRSVFGNDFDIENK